MHFQLHNFISLKITHILLSIVQDGHFIPQLVNSTTTSKSNFTFKSPFFPCYKGEFCFSVTVCVFRKGKETLLMLLDNFKTSGLDLYV